ncbi:hypothetical protein CA13_71140 [Planctomycetes bacterium CA13]|uniref:Uncharacterized protein n=1 Tax=Novipirellula herctigrandis TaxID=2527986 RepID=A0A5C5YP54_9BACT|nr:hypothetical protein CA13_71140 [Planctomycetes bacterium CA13]
MAKKKSKVNRAAAIREFDEAHPGTSPTVVAAELKKNGVNVSVQYVSTIRSQARKSSGMSRKRGRPAGKKSTSASRSVRKTSTVRTTSFEALLQLKEISNQLGGYDQTRQALDLLEAVSR